MTHRPSGPPRSSLRWGVPLLLASCTAPKDPGALETGDSADHSEPEETESGAESDGETQDETSGETADTGPPTRWTSVAAGFHITCGIREDGTLQCWGAEEWEDRDDHSWYDTDDDDPPPGQYVQVHLPVGETDSGGGWHGCAIATDGSAVCWGRDSSGEASPPPDLFVDIATDIKLSCGLTTSGTVTCWGLEEPSDLLPEKADFADMDCGWGEVCVRDTLGSVRCATGGGEYAPFGPGILDFEVQQDEACVIKEDRSLECWRLEAHGKGPSRMEDPPKGTFTEVCRGAYYACAIDETGIPACWDGMSSDLAIPTEPVHDISCGFGHACGLTDDGRILCWGANDLGQGDVPY